MKQGFSIFGEKKGCAFLWLHNKRRERDEERREGEKEGNEEKVASTWLEQDSIPRRKPNTSPPNPRFGHFIASWGVNSGKDSGDAPQLKGAGGFLMMKSRSAQTISQQETREDPETMASRRFRQRAMQGSKQDGVEFKTEIELLSRVHHKNLVGLVGLCFDRGGQMILHEFVPKGSLKDSLSGMQTRIINFAYVYASFFLQIALTFCLGGGLSPII
ncbi:putative leucine-rich repeat receptor-like protein kinase [Nymphaea thermarum]|nr:putative leucine-rich repeat receptor-like protein kinase [Nymphaea thermarum]